MYHIGIVKNVLRPDKKSGIISSDNSTQAVIQMWDENLLIIGVEKKLVPKLKEGSYVIADYTPLTPESNNRKMVIVKILPKASGAKLWRDFEAEFAKKKAKMSQQQPKVNYPYIR